MINGKPKIKHRKQSVTWSFYFPCVHTHSPSVSLPVCPPVYLLVASQGVCSNKWLHPALLPFCFLLCPSWSAVYELYIQGLNNTGLQMFELSERPKSRLIAARLYIIIFPAENICRKKQLIKLSKTQQFLSKCQEQKVETQSFRKQCSLKAESGLFSPLNTPCSVTNRWYFAFCSQWGRNDCGVIF